MAQTATPTATKRAAQPSYRVGGDVTPTPWAFGEEHLAWRETMRNFSRERVAPGAAERSRDKVCDTALLSELGSLGIYGLLMPPPLGGGADLRTLCITLEELAYYDSSVAVTAHVAAGNAYMLAALLEDRPALHDEIAPQLAAGEVFACFALTEPTGGSDASNVSTSARRDGSDWILNGAKQFITNAGTPMSRYAVTMATTADATPGGRPTVSAFLVPLDSPGVTVAPAYDKLGWRASDTHPIFYDEVRLPGDALLGEEGRGMAQALESLTWARIPFAAIGAGLARACLDETIQFTADRTSFGRRLSAHQAVGFKLADMAADVATAVYHTYDAAWKYDNGYSIEFEAAASKLTAGEIANRVAYEATQLHGGYGFMRETAVVRHYQDARILTIAEGTSEIQRLLLARYLTASA
jgi:short-chain 2-methylacyl-CoA dehydrogenase